MAEVVEKKGDQLPLSEIPGVTGISYFGAFIDRLHYLWFDAPDKYFPDRMSKYTSTVSGPTCRPTYAGDPRVVILLDSKSFRTLFDNSLFDTRAGMFLVAITWVLSYLDTSEDQHTRLKSYVQRLFMLMLTDGSRRHSAAASSIFCHVLCSEATRSSPVRPVQVKKWSPGSCNGCLKRWFLGFSSFPSERDLKRAARTLEDPTAIYRPVQQFRWIQPSGFRCSRLKQRGEVWAWGQPDRRASVACKRRRASGRREVTQTTATHSGLRCPLRLRCSRLGRRGNGRKGNRVRRRLGGVTAGEGRPPATKLSPDGPVRPPATKLSPDGPVRLAATHPRSPATNRRPPTSVPLGQNVAEEKPARFGRLSAGVGPPSWQPTSGDAGGGRRRPPTVLGGLPAELHRPPAVRQASDGGDASVARAVQPPAISFEPNRFSLFLDRFGAIASRFGPF
ncbi:hypothetical protein EJ110_NYTH20698 [Nymphaea thermarum]|nr:hypothetical protein EJ110_NYTH20698 [Nymphaea thermarum]